MPSWLPTGNPARGGRDEYSVEWAAKGNLAMVNATHGLLTVEQLRQLVAADEVDTVVSAICDMQGRLLGKTFRADFFVEHCLEHGSHFCTYLLGTDMEMTTPEGFPGLGWESGYGDWRAQPDWRTLRRIPWLEKTALILADVVDDVTQSPVSVAPRSMLRRQIERAAALGLRLEMATELEYYLLEESYAKARAQGYVQLQPFGWYNEDYHLFQAAKTEPLYRQLRNLMSEAGVPIEGSKGEAAPGQHEINLRPADPLEAADRHALFKHGAKVIAYQHGQAITFMAKPDQLWAGSSGHIHVSLWDPNGQRNLGAAEGGAPDAMAPTMRHFLAGLLACTRELALFIAPNINSYKRYVASSWAPVSLVWGRDNRTCGFRVVGHGPALRIENRFPGADANPYLAYAAVIAAGLYGIERALEPPDEYRGNGYAATGVPRMPRALYEAITALERSAMARAAFGDGVVEHYLNSARVEQAAGDAAVSAWERERYLERG
jgi:glutamine synthetase